jgi:hypothetical protein
MSLIPQKLLLRVAHHFDGNINRAKLWFEIDNPILGGIKPKDYKIGGNWRALEKMIEDALEEEDATTINK